MDGKGVVEGSVLFEFGGFSEELELTTFCNNSATGDLLAGQTGTAGTRV